MKPTGLSCSFQKKKSTIKSLLRDKSKRWTFPNNGNLVSCPAALSSTEASLYRREGWREEKKKARGGRREGERRSPFHLVVTRMDTSKSGWTPYVYYTTLYSTPRYARNQSKRQLCKEKSWIQGLAPKYSN